MHDSSARDPPPRCHPDTRKSIIKDLMKWIQDPKPDADVFWLHGTAGVGKSAILQTIADLLREMGQRFAGSFFFGRNKPGRDRSHYLIPTIAYQLAMLIPDLRRPIDQTMCFDPTVVKKRLDVQLQSLITGPCQQLSISILASHTPTVIIDGLDECNDHEQQLAILSVIAKAVTVSHVPLRFLIASRPEPHISQFFKEASFKYASLWVAIDTQEVRDDIRKVFIDGFEKIQRRQAFYLGSFSKPWPGDEVICLLVARASGQFIYADTVLRFVGAKHHKPSKQLDIIVNMPHPSSSTALAAVDQLYMQILHSCPYPKILDYVFGLMVQGGGYAGVIEDLLSLDDGEVLTVLQPLHSVIQCRATEAVTPTVPEVNELPCHPDIKLSFYHTSFSEFLQDRCRSGIFYVNRAAVLSQVETRAANIVISSLQLPTACRVRRRTWSYMRRFCLSIFGEINYLASLHDAMQTLIKYCEVFPPSSTHFYALQYICLKLRTKYPPTTIPEEESQLSLSILGNCQKCLDRWYFHCFSTSRLVEDSPMALVLLCSPEVKLLGMREVVNFGVVLEFLTRYPYLFDTFPDDDDLPFWNAGNAPRFVQTVREFLLDETRSRGLHSVLRNQWADAVEPLFSVGCQGHGFLSVRDLSDHLLRLRLGLASHFFRTSRISDIRHCNIREPRDASPFGRLIQHLPQIDFTFPNYYGNSGAIPFSIGWLVEDLLFWAHRQKENKKCKEDVKKVSRLVMDKIFSGNFLLSALWTDYFPTEPLDLLRPDSIPPVGMSEDRSILGSLDWFLASYASICECLTAERRSTERTATIPTYHTRITEFLLHAAVTLLHFPHRVCSSVRSREPLDYDRREDISMAWKEFTDLDVKWSWHLGFSQQSEKITVALATIHHQCTAAEEKAEKLPHDLTLGAVIYLQKVAEPEYDYLTSWYKDFRSWWSWYKELEETYGRPLHTRDYTKWPQVARHDGAPPRPGGGR